MTNAENITPLAMERAVLDLREIADSDVYDRLLNYLRHSRPTLAEIKEAVCEFYAIPDYDLTGRCREYECAQARQIFCYLAHRYTRWSMQNIAPHVGLYDHSTVSHAVRKIEKHIITKPLLADDVDLLRMRISEKVLLREAKRC
jgi:chromosomal replication initiator protein